MPLTPSQETRRLAILEANQALINTCHALTQRGVRLADLAEDIDVALTSAQALKIIQALRTIFDRIVVAHATLQALKP